jgi:four helix bundle protein
MKEMEEYKFDFEKLEVYQRGLKFVDKVFEITEKFSHNLQFSLGDQFRRAALSIVNNIAEGSGKKTSNAKRQLYSYGLDSGRECIPMITLSMMRAQITLEDQILLREECVSICNMLAKLIHSVKQGNI